jgi:hypothetical protein
MSITALRARCWGVISSELDINHLLEERRAVGADTGLPRGGESMPELGWVTGQSTSHGSATEISSVTACEVSLVVGSDAGGAATRLVATWERRKTMVSR